MSSALQAHRVLNLPPSFYYIPNFINPEEEAHLLSKARFPARFLLQINASPIRWTQLTHRRLQVYPSRLTPKNVLLAQPLPTWLTDPILRRFHDLSVFTEDEEEEQEDTPSAEVDSTPTDAELNGESHDDQARTANKNTPNGSANARKSGTPHAAPNHILINEYPPGQGIMPHEDGDAYAPVVATVSLGGHCVLDLYDKTTPDGETKDGEPEDEHGSIRKRYRILQEPRSLLITRGPAYKSLLHGIADVHTDVNLSRNEIVNWDLLGEPGEYAEGVKERELRVSLTFRDVLKVSTVGKGILGRGRR